MAIDPSVNDWGIEQYLSVKRVTKNGTVEEKIRALCSRGEHSMVLSAMRGHRDSYTAKKTSKEAIASLQSKLTFPLGPATAYSANDCKGKLPIGSLVFPQFSIYTDCRPLHDIEMHYLPEVIHLSACNPLQPDHRGCVDLVAKQSFVFGGAVTRFLLPMKSTD
jgi:hypothetical protein